MHLIQSAADMRAFSNQCFLEGRSIGFVPTMGALHSGHISLLSKAASENDVTVCSIFVNPAQFNNREDLLKYPRTPESDLKMLEAAGCTAVWMPQPADMYPHKPATGFTFGPIENVLEGTHRPGHFAGVGLVLSKFFNLLQPCSCYMGLKDLQQFLVVKQMVEELNFNIRLIGCPTVREEDGLAMSSRNVRLSASHRAQAPVLYRELVKAASAIKNGTQAKTACHLAIAAIESDSDGKVEYFEAAAMPDLQPLNSLPEKEEIALLLAVFYGDIRLIDNIIVELN
ncbi:MAG: pantoate--beta-alanine ligase [Bacteroidota bacterium]